MIALNSQINITHIVQPDVGAVFATYCPLCKSTQIGMNIYGAKPKDGDFWFMPKFCENISHAMQLDTSELPRSFPWKQGV